VSYSPGDATPKGNLTYQNHKVSFKLKAVSFDLPIINRGRAWFTGTGVLDNGLNVAFTVEVNES
jgi:hypothetical protein